MSRSYLCLATVFLSMVYYGHAQASISLAATRVVFEAKDKEASLTVRSSNDQALMIQTWLEPGPDAEENIPFAINPPLARVDAKGQQILRIMYQGTGAPTGRESVYFINVQEIPQRAKEKNILQLAVRQRIKLFYRPAGLPGEVKNAAKELIWQIERSANGTALSIVNKSAFHVSFVGLALEGNTLASSHDAQQMISPGETKRIALKNSAVAASTKVSFQSINDFGGLEDYKVEVLAGRPVKAIRLNAK